MRWQLLINAQFDEEKWSYSPLTFANHFRIVQEHSPKKGNFTIGQFLDFQGRKEWYHQELLPAQSEGLRLMLPLFPGEIKQYIGIRFRYPGDPKDVPRWRIKLYASNRLILDSATREIEQIKADLDLLKKRVDRIIKKQYM